jgi:predicted MFS family arabinose efflux permease
MHERPVQTGTMMSEQGRFALLHPVQAVLCLSAFFATLNFMAPTPFYPQIAADLRTTVPLVGQIVTLMTFVSAGLGLVVGPLADRYGFRWPLVVGLLTIAIFLLGTGLAHTYPVLLAVGIVSGLGDALVYSLPFAIAATYFQGDAQRRAIGWTIGALTTAPMIGIPLLTALAAVSSWRVALATAGVAAIGVAWLVAAVLPVDRRRPTMPLHVRAWLGAYAPLLHHPASLRFLAVSALRGMWWIGLMTYLGAFLQTALGLSKRGAGLVYALGGGVYTLGSVVAGRVATISPRVLATVSSLVAAMLVGPMLMSPPLWAVVLLFLLISMAAGVCTVGIVSMLASESPAGAATTMVLNGSVLNLGAAGGASLCGILIALSGYSALAIGLPIFALTAAVLAWWPPRRDIGARSQTMA